LRHADNSGDFSVTDDELTAVRSALAARVTGCWDRLDDVISELIALHEVTGDEILARVRKAIESESPADVRTTAAL
jgi:hypothetical protein